MEQIDAILDRGKLYREREIELVLLLQSERQRLVSNMKSAIKHMLDHLYGD